MNEEDTDPMLGTDDDKQEYFQKITEMIAHDVEQRREQRLAEFQQGQYSKAVIVGVTGVGDGLINSVNDQSAA